MRNPLLLAACLFAAGPAAIAQVVIPPGVEPGQIQRGLQQMRAPEHSALQATPAAPVQVAPPETAALRFMLRGLVVEGATVYPAAQLSASYQRFIGQEIPVAQVFAIANEITAKYRRDG